LIFQGAAAISFQPHENGPETSANSLAARQWRVASKKLIPGTVRLKIETH
jgi:hypothetical protein